MSLRSATVLAALLVLLAGGGWSPLQAQSPPPWDTTATGALPTVPQPKRTTTGLCTILRGDQVLDQQNCKALADASEEASGGGFAKGITYVWPSGNRTMVGGSDEDFLVNGNVAVPLPDSNRGLCLKVEKTGNTFCFKEGAKVKAAAAQPVAQSPAPPAGSASGPRPVETKRSEGATAVAGAPVAGPAASATAPSLADRLAEEAKLRKAAEDELKVLRDEIARLNEIEEKRLAELAEQKRSSEAAEKTKSEEKAREDAAAAARKAALEKDIEAFKTRCATGDIGACEAALALVKSTTADAESEAVAEVELMLESARTPRGVSFLATIPRSTWAVGTLAGVLALAVIALAVRRREQSTIERYRSAALTPPPLPTLGPDPALDARLDSHPPLEAAPSPSLEVPVEAELEPQRVEPTLDELPFPPKSAALEHSQEPSLDPFADLPDAPPPLPSPRLDPAPARAVPPPVPPPIPSFSAMQSLYPPKS